MTDCPLTSTTPLSQQWAWQGLAWGLPAGWEVTVIDKTYIRIDDAHGPRMEIAWRPRMTISKSTLRTRLRRILGKATMTFDLAICPAQSDAKLAFRFAYPDSQAPHPERPEGVGMAFALPANLTAMVLLHGNEAEDAALFHQAMAGISVPTSPEHPTSHVPWRAFGLEMVVPTGYQLTRFHFRPGHFHLQFMGPKHGLLRQPTGMIAYDRLGPAKVLLRGRTLLDWARSFHASLRLQEETSEELPVSPCHPPTDPEVEGPRCVMWRVRKHRPAVVSWWRRFWGVSWKSFAARMWLADAESKIMAVLAKGEPAKDSALFADLCQCYETST